MIYEKLLEVQKAGIALRKDAVNPHFKNTYVTLDAVLATVLPILNEKGIVVTQVPAAAGEQPALKTVMYDTEDGTFIEGGMPMVLDRVSPQAVGSAITYYRRYSILAMLGLTADEDDDAEKASTSHDNTLASAWGTDGGF